MIKFAMEVCDIQRREGRYFVFEQPQGSRAWDLEAVKKMVMRQGVDISTMHQCMYGLKARDTMGEASAYKPTRVLTNHEALAEALSRQCNGMHRHAHLVGKTACTKAAVYPEEMCTEVLKAVAVIKKGIEETQLYGVDREDMCEDDNMEEVTGEGYNDFYYEGIVDSVTGEGLEPTQVKAGCDEALKYMKSMKVWDRVLRSGVRDKIVGSRWVYAKKPNLVSCRLVAQEFAGSEKREDLYAGTPPMAATRYLLSDTVSRGRGAAGRRRKLMVLDVKRAFLN